MTGRLQAETISMDVLLAVQDTLTGPLRRLIERDLPEARVLVAAPADFATMVGDRRWALVVVCDDVLNRLGRDARASLPEESLVLVPDVAPGDPVPAAEEIAGRVLAAASGTPTPAVTTRRAEEALQRFIATHRESPPVMREILRLFAEEAPQRLRSIDEGLSTPGSASTDCTAVAKAAHSLANTCGTLHCTVAVDEARALEAAARKERPESCLLHAARLVPIVSALVETVRAHLAHTCCDESDG